MKSTEQQIIETIATKVMGWSELSSPYYPYYMDAASYPAFYFAKETGTCIVFEQVGDSYNVNDWNPLQNIADAWQVLEKFELNEIHKVRDEYICWIYHENNGNCDAYEAKGETAQVAICQAALKVLTHR